MKKMFASAYKLNLFDSELNINVAGLIRTHWSVYCYELMLKHDEELICYVEDQYGRETAPGQLHFLSNAWNLNAFTTGSSPIQTQFDSI